MADAQALRYSGGICVGGPLDGLYMRSASRREFYSDPKSGGGIYTFYDETERWVWESVPKEKAAP